MIYTDLSESGMFHLLDQVNSQTNFDHQTIEKDWWVTQVLRVLFSQPYAEHLSFKGGTSLSKAWNVIQRFSEDIDIAISREYLGFAGELSRTMIYGDSVPFDELLTELRALNARIRELPYRK